MIDIHTHVIFGVDDGPQTIQDSVDLIQKAYEQGVRVIVATTHHRKDLFAIDEDELVERFKQLYEIVRDKWPDLTLLFGRECYCSSRLVEQLPNKNWCLNKTNYILLEFSSKITWQQMNEAIRNILLKGLTPVLAHIERYDVLAYNADYVKDLIALGCYTQVNSSHALPHKWFNDSKKELKKRVRYFLNNRLVHCVASDMHNVSTRPPYMKEAYDFICQIFDEDYAKELFYTNPHMIVNNELI